MDNATVPADKQRKLMIIIYAFWVAGILSRVLPILGLLPLVALIMAVIKRKEMTGTIYHSHCTWIIRTFLIGLAGIAVSMVLMILPPVGMLAFAILSLWGLWRLIKGAMRMYENKPVENPQSFF